MEEVPTSPQASVKRRIGLPKIVLFCVIGVLVIGVGIVATLFLLGKTSLPFGNNSLSTTLSDKSKTSRVKGNAGEFYPYGDIKEENVVSQLITNTDGGVVTVELANNVRAYLVVAPGYSDPEGNIYKLTPYYSMPTSKNAPSLPTDLGYGVDFEIENNHSGTIPNLYLVFDLDQGKTVNAIAKDNKVNSFCLPTLPTFNPIGCDLLKGISLSDHTNTKYGVVSPVRDLDHNDLMFMASTIPIGYDNLIVTQISNQATFIPIVLSKDALTDVVRADKPGYTIPLIEAMVHAVNNDIFYSDPEVYYSLNKAFSTLGDPIESNKALQILPKYQDYLNKLKTHTNEFANEKVSSNTTLNYINLQLNDYASLGGDITNSSIKTLNDNSVTSSSNAYVTLSDIFQIRRLETAGFNNAKSIRDGMVANILKNVNYYIDNDSNLTPNTNDYLMLSAAIWGTPEYFDKTRLTANNNLNIISSVFGQSSSSILPSDAPQSWRDGYDRADRAANAPLQNPCNYSYSQLLQAARLAQLLGNENTSDQLIDEIKQRLIDSLRSGSYDNVLRDWALAQLLGLDSDYSCITDLYKEKALKANKMLKCTTLMEKNLKNFGQNEIDCTEVSRPNPTPPTIPDNCKLPKRPVICS